MRPANTACKNLSYFVGICTCTAEERILQKINKHREYPTNWLCMSVYMHNQCKYRYTHMQQYYMYWVILSNHFVLIVKTQYCIVFPCCSFKSTAISIEIRSTQVITRKLLSVQKFTTNESLLALRLSERLAKDTMTRCRALLRCFVSLLGPNSGRKAVWLLNE